MASDYPHLETIAVQLIGILAPRRNYSFTRKIHIEENCRGDVDVSRHRVIIHPLFLTGGDPVATIEHVLDVCKQFDREYEAQSRRAIVDLKYKLRWTISELLRLDEADSIRAILEEELSLGSEELLVLEEIAQ